MLDPQFSRLLHRPDPDRSAPKGGTFLPETGEIGPEIDRDGPGIDRDGPIGEGRCEPPRHDRLVMRCTPEFHAWCAGLADYMGVGLTTILEQSLRVYAESRMYPALPPRRFVPSARIRAYRRGPSGR